MSTDSPRKEITCSTEENFLYCTESRALYSGSGWQERSELIASGHIFYEGKQDLRWQ